MSIMLGIKKALKVNGRNTDQTNVNKSANSFSSLDCNQIKKADLLFMVDLEQDRYYIYFTNK